MKHFLLFGLMVIMLGLTACPYKADTPLDEGSYTVPAWLKGKWLEIKKNGTGDRYELGATGGKKGALFAMEIDSTGKRTGLPRKIVMSKLGNKIFMNVYDKGDEGEIEGYYIFQFRRISDEEFELWPLPENSKIRNLNELKEYLLQNENNDAIYDANDKSTYKRM